MISDIAPLFLTGWFFVFLVKNKTNEFIPLLLILSYFAFASNFNDLGLGFDFYRYLHKIIGILAILHLAKLAMSAKSDIFSSEIFYIFILFIFAIFISIFQNKIFYDHYFHYLTNAFFIALVSIYFFFRIDSKKKLEIVNKFIFSLSSILTVFTILEFLSHYGFLEQINYFNDGTYEKLTIPVRTTLFFNNPNYLAFSILIGFTYSLFNENKNFIIWSLFMAFAIFTTGSKAAEISVVFVYILFFIKNKYFLDFLKILIFILIAFLLTAFYETIVSNNNDVIDKTRTRYSLSLIGYEMFLDNPVNGVGYGQFRTKYKDYISNDILNLGNHEIANAKLNCDGNKNANCPEIMTHNDLLTIITELGTVGIIFLVIVFKKIIRKLKYLHINKSQRTIYYGSLISSILIFSLFHNNITSYIFWFLLLMPLAHKE